MKQLLAALLLLLSLMAHAQNQTLKTYRSEFWRWNNAEQEWKLYKDNGLDEVLLEFTGKSLVVHTSKPSVIHYVGSLIKEEGRTMVRAYDNTLREETVIIVSKTSLGSVRIEIRYPRLDMLIAYYLTY